MNRRQTLSAVIACSAPLSLVLPARAASKEEERADVKKMVQETLSKLYAVQPLARKAVESSAGYAVFSNFGMKIFVAGGGSGEGLAVDRKTKAETFMKMVEVQTGLGFGVKKFRLVWVFEQQKLLSGFVNSGWEFAAQATAAAKTGDKGKAFAGAVSVQPGIWLYQLTEDGLAAELTVKGTKYYKDKDLN